MQLRIDSAGSQTTPTLFSPLRTKKRDAPKAFVRKAGRLAAWPGCAGMPPAAIFSL
jgi:hypothetical protein